MTPDARTDATAAAGTAAGEAQDGPPSGGSPDAPTEDDPGAAGRPAPGPDPALSRPGTERPEISLVSLPGRTAYREALELQRGLARARIEGRLERDVLLLVEHDPVVTLGRGTEEDRLGAGGARLEKAGVEIVEIERGGDVTYHGPGQLVGYPILDLGDHRKDLHWYLRAVEEALIRALGELGLPSFRLPGHTGVWVGDREAARTAEPDADVGEGAPPVPAPDAPAAGAGAEDAAEVAVLEGRLRKIASIGVHVSRWVTWHGFALNVTEEPMENFRLIVPCGIRGVHMTSVRGEGIGAGRASVREAVAAGFASVFDARLVARDGPPEVGDASEEGVGNESERGRGGRSEQDLASGPEQEPEGPPGRAERPVEAPRR